MDLQSTLYLKGGQLERASFNLAERSQLIEAMVQLIKQARPVEWLGDYPTGLDLQELLALDEVCAATHIWRDKTGKWVAFAYLDPFDNLVFECVDNKDFEPLFLLEVDAAIQTMRKKFRGDPGHTTLDGSCRSNDFFRIRLFERAGFKRSEFESVFLSRDLTGGIKKPPLPEGYRVRPLKGTRELDAYITLHQAAFGTGNMTRAFRESIMATESYIPELDLVLETPEGNLAGFCVCQTGVTEGEGWTDPIGIHPDYQGKGLGKAILLFGLNKLREQGIKMVKLGTRSDNHAMLALANSAGFCEDSRRAWFSKDLY